MFKAEIVFMAMSFLFHIRNKSFYDIVISILHKCKVLQWKWYFLLLC